MTGKAGLEWDRRAAMGRSLESNVMQSQYGKGPI